MSLLARLAPHLPYIRRYARALTGDQQTGDHYVRVALEALAAGERSLVPTGVALAIPPGYVGLVHPRSGLAARHGITIVNAPGTVDSGYRGEVLVNLVNLDPREAFTVRRGDRIAQLVVQQVATVRFTEVVSAMAANPDVWGVERLAMKVDGSADFVPQSAGQLAIPANAVPVLADGRCLRVRFSLAARCGDA